MIGVPVRPTSTRSQISIVPIVATAVSGPSIDFATTNVVVDCDSGICLGNSHKPDDVPIHCTGVVVRNNFVCRASENGILADYTRDCAILHNTIHDPRSRLGRLIRLVHDNDGLRVVSNLLDGPPPRIESSKMRHNGPDSPRLT